MRDRFLKLERGFKRKMVEKEQASVISAPEPTEVEAAIREIIERGGKHKMLWLGESKMLWKKKGRQQSQ